jgi:hypothetical protein
MVEQVVLFVLMSLASYRLWRLVGYDDVTSPARDRILEHAPYLHDMVICPWCLGSWIAFAVVWVTTALVEVRWPVLQALAVAVMVGWVHGTLEANDAFEVELDTTDTLDVRFESNRD